MTLFACVVGDSQEERAVGKTGETLQHGSGSGSGSGFSFGFGGLDCKGRNGDCENQCGKVKSKFCENEKRYILLPVRHDVLPQIPFLQLLY